MNDECVDPICDNCHSVNDTFFECGHEEGDPDGAPCAITWCIKNVMDSASCDYKGYDWPCKKSRCDTTSAFYGDEITVYILSPSYCIGGNIDWTIRHEMCYGCTDCFCINQEVACVVDLCVGPITETYGRGNKKECGGCP